MNCDEIATRDEAVYKLEEALALLGEDDKDGPLVRVQWIIAETIRVLISI